MQAAHAVEGFRAARPASHLVSPRIGTRAKPMFDCRPIFLAEISPAIAQGIKKIALVQRSPEGDVGQPQEDLGSLARRQERLTGRPDSQSGENLLVVRRPSRD